MVKSNQTVFTSFADQRDIRSENGKIVNYRKWCYDEWRPLPSTCRGCVFTSARWRSNGAERRRRRHPRNRAFPNFSIFKNHSIYRSLYPTRTWINNVIYVPDATDAQKWRYLKFFDGKMTWGTLVLETSRDVFQTVKTCTHGVMICSGSSRLSSVFQILLRPVKTSPLFRLYFTIRQIHSDS